MFCIIGPIRLSSLLFFSIWFRLLLLWFLYLLLFELYWTIVLGRLVVLVFLYRLGLLFTMILGFERERVMEFKPSLFLQVLDCAFNGMDFFIIITFKITIAEFQVFFFFLSWLFGRLTLQIDFKELVSKSKFWICLLFRTRVWMFSRSKCNRVFIADEIEVEVGKHAFELLDVGLFLCPPNFLLIL